MKIANSVLGKGFDALKVEDGSAMFLSTHCLSRRVGRFLSFFCWGDSSIIYIYGL